MPNATTLASLGRVFFGQGLTGNTVAAVGWFEVNDTGAVIDAHVDARIGKNVHKRLAANLSAGSWTLTLINSENGTYLLDFLVGDLNFEHLRIIGTVLLDDVHGRHGSVAGQYPYRIFFPIDDQDFGILKGVITAR